MKIYPVIAEKPVEEDGPISESQMARRIIDARETGVVTVGGSFTSGGKTFATGKCKVEGEGKAACLGPCLRLPNDPDATKDPGRGSDQIKLFNRIWKEIDAEAAAMDSVKPGDFTDKAAYKKALAATGEHLSSATYADAIMAKHGVKTHADLVKALNPET